MISSKCHVAEKTNKTSTVNRIESVKEIRQKSIISRYIQNIKMISDCVFFSHFDLDRDYGCLSSWYPCKFEDELGRRFSSVDQYMMYHKAILVKNDALACDIMKENNPKNFARFDRFSNSEWNQENMKIVTNGCYLKFSQNEEMKKYLLRTNPIIVKACLKDKIWGIGVTRSEARMQFKWQGQNKLGRCLMLARSRIEAETNVGAYTNWHKVYATKYPKLTLDAQEKKMDRWLKIHCHGHLAKLMSNIIDSTHLTDDDWSRLKSYETWGPILRAKFGQNFEAQELLLSTGKKLLYEVGRMARTKPGLWDCQIFDDTGCNDWSAAAKKGSSEGFAMKTFKKSERNHKDQSPKIFGDNLMGRFLMRLRKEYIKTLPDVPNTAAEQEAYIKEHDGFAFGSNVPGARLLSNFHYAEVIIEDTDVTYVYPTSEHAYQSLKDKPENRYKWCLLVGREEKQFKKRKIYSEGGSSSKKSKT